MRFLRLDLLAFGPFGNVSLPLDQGNYGFQLVYGDNEAGKSSALRALTQLLYGIPHNTSDSFLHAYTNLRIGGVLQGSDGVTLECIRRKGRTGTLRDADDVEPIDASCLERLLDGVDENAFRQRFGIDYDQLIDGGQAIVRGSGDLGTILFAAGAGIANLNAVQKSLLEEAERLFRPRGSTQVINKALAAYHEARKKVRADLLPSAEWAQHDEALAGALDRKAEIETELIGRRARQQQLERIRDAVPLIAQRSLLQEKLAAVDDAPLLSEAFSERRREAVSQLNAARQANENLQQSIQRLGDAIEQLEVPPALLEHATAITTLHTELGGFKKAAGDRPGLLVRQHESEASARAILQKLGHEPDLDCADDLRLGEAQRLRIQTLGNEFKGVVTKQENALERRRQLDQELDDVQQRLKSLTPPANTQNLRHAIRDAQRSGDLDDRIDAHRRELVELRQQAEIDLSKLPLWSGPLDDLEQLAVSPVETIERFDMEFSAGKTTIDTAGQRLVEEKEKFAALEQQIQQLELEADIPTEADLDEARRRRDQGWQLVRRAWLKTSPADDTDRDFVEHFAPGRDLADAFEKSFQQADSLGDRLRHEADRVAARARLEAERTVTQQRIATLGQQMAEARAALEGLQDDWHDLWQPLGISALPPREMMSWHHRHAKLVEIAERIRKQTETFDELTRQAGDHRARLSTCLVELELPAATAEDPLPAVLERAGEALDRIEQAASERAGLESQRQKLSRQREEADRQLQHASEDVQQWRRQWSAATGPLGLEKEAQPAEANAVLASIDELLSKLRDAEDKRHRISGIDGDAKKFEDNVRRLTKDISPELDDIPADQAVVSLYDRLLVTQTAQARREEMVRQRTEETNKLDTVDEQIRDLSATLSTMCAEVGCEVPDELPELERRSATRQSLEAEITATEHNLLHLSAGVPLDDFVRHAATLNPDELSPTIDQLADDIADLEKEKAQVAETIGSERNELKRMDGSSKAAEAHEQAEQLLALIDSEVEQYTRLRLATEVLRGAIERYQDKHQGPLLERAGEIFAELTLDSFAKLRAEYTGKGDAELVCVRNGDKQPVGLDGLSDGTECQLYLALRLASLERYVAERQPMPFIVDDILKDFDDDRAVAALKTLARFSERTQVILFTHHRHLVQLAVDNLDHDVLFVHDLDKLKAAAAVPST